MCSLTPIFKPKHSNRSYQVVSLSRMGAFGRKSTLVLILSIEFSFRKENLRKMEYPSIISLIRKCSFAKSSGHLWCQTIVPSSLLKTKLNKPQISKDLFSKQAWKICNIWLIYSVKGTSCKGVHLNMLLSLYRVRYSMLTYFNLWIENCDCLQIRYPALSMLSSKLPTASLNSSLTHMKPLRSV